MIKLILDALFPYIVTAVIGFIVYKVHHRWSPPKYYQLVEARMRHYAFVLFMLWFIGMATPVTLVYVVESHHEIQECIADMGCTARLAIRQTIVYGMVLSYLALLALIPSFTLFLALMLFHPIVAIDQKLKRMSKINQYRIQFFHRSNHGYPSTQTRR